MAKASETDRRRCLEEIEAWRQSGESLSAWARQRGLSRDALEYWKRRLAGQPEKLSGTVGPLTLIPVASPAAQPTPAAPIEILIERAGLRILLPTGFDTAGLVRLLDVVDARC